VGVKWKIGRAGRQPCEFDIEWMSAARDTGIARGAECLGNVAPEEMEAPARGALFDAFDSGFVRAFHREDGVTVAGTGLQSLFGRKVLPVAWRRGALEPSPVHATLFSDCSSFSFQVTSKFRKGQMPHTERYLSLPARCPLIRAKRFSRKRAGVFASKLFLMAR
jgi:hypothetical protein